MGRRTLRNRTKQRGGVAMTDELWGQHLYADILHDFGDINSDNPVGAPDKFYNIGGSGVQAQLVNTGERQVMEYLFNREPDASPRKTFLNNPIEFFVPERTAQSSAVVLTPIQDISNFGVVYDAGTFITSGIGANHVVTFGNILDPASSVTNESTNPIFFKSEKEGSRDFTFSLTQFGFDSTKAGDICIKNVTTKDAMVGIVLDGNAYDAISLAQLPGGVFSANTPKPIGDVSIATSGIFTSIAKAKAANVGKPETWFKIGKSLGDTLLVASIMPAIGVSNNIFLKGDGTWVDYNHPEKPAKIPTKFMLKTGDALNHTRAVLKDIPSILERPGTKKYVKRYEFIPSVPGEVAGVVDRFIAMKSNLVDSIGAAYTNLINALGTMVVDGKVTPENQITIVDFDERPNLSDDASRKVAAAINEIQGDLRTLANYIQGRMGDVDITAETYKDAFNFVRAIIPNASVFVNNRAEKTTKPNKTIVVTTAASFSGINIPGMEIPYHNILARARSGRDLLLDGDYRSLLKIKLDTLVGAGAGQQGGADTENIYSSPWEHPTSKHLLYQAAEPSFNVISKDGELEQLIAPGMNDDECISVFPTIQLFLDYLYKPREEDGAAAVGPPINYSEVVVKKLLGLRHATQIKPNLFEDLIVLERLLEELEKLENMKVYEIEGDSNVPNLTAVLEFNKFVMNIYIELAESGNVPNPERVDKLKKEIEFMKSIAGAPREKRALEPAPAPASDSEEASAEPSSNSRSGYSSDISVAQAQASPVPAAPAVSEAPDSAPRTAQASQQPSSGSSDDEAPDVSRVLSLMSPQKKPRGGLRRTYRKQKNARTATSRISRNSRLRKWKGTRSTRRV